MDETQVIEMAQSAVYTLLLVATPVIVVGLIVGLVIALFQALTQIQEMTLTFAPKILAVVLSLLVFLPFMLEAMRTFSATVFDRIQLP